MSKWIKEKMNGYIMGSIHHFIKKQCVKLLKIGKIALYNLNV